MKKYQVIKIEIENGKRELQQKRAQCKALSSKFSYDYISSGYARISTFSKTFEDYLELLAKLPIDNELHSYDLSYFKSPNDSLRIVHRVNYPNNIVIYYIFIVGDVENTLNKLTEGKCKIVEKTVVEKQRNYTSLSCNI